VMHGGDALPMAAETDVLSDVLPLMSAKGFGVLIVLDAQGKLGGIVTDGDLRRRMSPELPASLLSGIMTRNPKTIGEDALAAEAMETLNSRKITSLVVVTEGRPVGLVHIQDLLRLGVA
jgi:arabinose-5-phosphate isomerase